jgi:hypothetical protein
VVTYDSIEMDNDKVIIYSDRDNNNDNYITIVVIIIVIIVQGDTFIGRWN